MIDRFDSLASRHKDSVYRQLVRMCGNRDDAEDALVESLTSAYRALGNLDDSERFRSWLGRIAVRACGKIKSHPGAGPLIALASLEGTSFEPSSQEPSPAQAALESEMRTCIHTAIDSMPEIYRQVYQYRDVEERSAEETAKLLGLSIPAVKSRLHRARKLLRASIDATICAE